MTAAPAAENRRVEIVTRWQVRVHAANRHAGYGTPVVVYADTRREAVSKAVDVGWGGYRGDARVTIDNVTQEPVVIPPAHITPLAAPECDACGMPANRCATVPARSSGTMPTCCRSCTHLPLAGGAS